MSILRWIRKLLGADEVQSEFTPRAQQVLAIARKIAAHRKSQKTEAEHLLAGILALGAGSAYESLARLGLDRQRAFAEWGIVDAWRTVTVAPNFAYGDSVKITLALAVRESRATNCSYVGTDHILIALADARSAAASEFLAQNGIAREKLRDVLETLRSEEAKKAPQPVQGKFR
jgi:ATP-dependent Clp protease ATP-binding subunit ClpC